MNFNFFGLARTLTPIPKPRKRAAKDRIQNVFDEGAQHRGVRSDGAEGNACWFVDTDYNEESFFVRHAYFLGKNDPYKALKTTRQIHGERRVCARG